MSWNNPSQPQSPRKPYSFRMLIAGFLCFLLPTSAPKHNIGKHLLIPLGTTMCPNPKPLN